MTHAPLMSLETELQALPLRRSQCWPAILGQKKAQLGYQKSFARRGKGLWVLYRDHLKRLQPHSRAPPFVPCLIGGIRGNSGRKIKVFHRQRSQKKIYGQTFLYRKIGLVESVRLV